MHSISLPVHSVIDVITNSSTSIYVQATKTTIKTVKELINAILRIADPTTSLTADDLFEFDLSYDDDRAHDAWYDDNYDRLSKLESKEVNDEWKKFIEENPDWISDYYDNSESYASVSLAVTPRTETPDTTMVAKILSDLTGLFNIKASYN